MFIFIYGHKIFIRSYSKQELSNSLTYIVTGNYIVSGNDAKRYEILKIF